MNVSTPRGILAGLALVLLASGSALGADAQAFGNRLKEAASGSSLPLNFQSAEASGDNVVLKGVTLGSGEDSSKLGDVTFESVTGSDAQGWKVARIPFSDIDTTQEGKAISVTGMAVEGLRIAGKEGASTLPGEAPYFFDSAAVNGVKVTNKGKEIISLGATTFTNAVDGDGKVSSDFTLGDFALDFVGSGEDDAAKTMTEVGYPQLSGDGSVATNWDPKSGDWNVDPFRLTAENAGELNVSYGIAGYTPTFAKSLGAIQKQMASSPEAAQSSGMAIIGLLSQLSIGSLEINFIDASLTGKLLDYYAKQNGQSREELISTIDRMVPQMLAALNNPGFQTEVSNAVTTFLKDPKSLTISVDPDKPIAATQLLGAAMGAPQTLPAVLQLHVTANDQTTDGGGTTAQ